jgi:hypothetical protein
MSPWTAFLESLHSALIDEVTDRHPEPKPELGLPLRQNRFALPAPELDELLLVDVSFSSSNGIALLASQKGFMKSLSLGSDALWNAMLKRAGTEFGRRSIQPQCSELQKFRSTDAFPSSTLKCARVIWIPIRLPGGQCFFGVGV